MRSKVADEVRREQMEELLKLTPGDRVEIARRLGEDGLLSYAKTHQVTREEAIRQIRNSRQAGRLHPSRCKGGD